MSVLEKIKNPNAGAGQIFLALLYIAVIGSLTCWALYAYYADKISSGIDNITF